MMPSNELQIPRGLHSANMLIIAAQAGNVGNWRSWDTRQEQDFWSEHLIRR